MGLKLFEIGNHAVFCEPGGMRDTALPYLSSLYVRGGECTVTLAVCVEDRILCVEKIRGHSSPRTESRVGWPLPAAQTSLGKVILAFSPPEFYREIVLNGLSRSTPYSIDQPRKLSDDLEEIRLTGVSFDNQEILVGLSGAAAPIFHDGEIVASVAITQRTSMFRPAQAKELVVSTARQLEQALERSMKRNRYVPLHATHAANSIRRKNVDPVEIG